MTDSKVDEMARGPKWNEKTVQRFLAEGRGKGQGADYRPWITVQDFSSSGESRRVLGLKTRREHQLMSNVEWSLFLLLEWSLDVVDIREQYPLDRDITQEIAASLGIKHPTYPGTRDPAVMTTDMLVTRVRDGNEVVEAFDAKRTEEAADPRSLEKLQIHRYYFEAAGIPHRLVFHSEIPQLEARNIEWIRSGALKPGELEPYPGFYWEHKDLMAQSLGHDHSGNLSEFCDYYDRQHGVPTGTGLRVAKLLMQDRTLLPDLTNPSLATAPLASFQRRAPRTLRLVGDGRC